jgi:hypothetical protein
MTDSVPFGSSSYCSMFLLLLFARGMDVLSTWVATPSLVFEGNPIARKMGWKWGILFNLAICFTFALWPGLAIVIATAGILVASHNFQIAWLMRSMGEDLYRNFFSDRLGRRGLHLCLICLCAETFLIALVGGALMFFSPDNTVPFAIGAGILAHAIVVFFYTGLAVWRIKRRMYH